MKNISFPNHWKSPKYSLGQLVKQGRIIGIEYQIPGTRRAYDLSKGWIYSVLQDDLGYDTENVSEADIQPPSKEQLQAEIDYEKSLAEIHLENCSVLTKQLLEVEQP